MFYSVA